MIVLRWLMRPFVLILLILLHTPFRERIEEWICSLDREE